MERRERHGVASLAVLLGLVATLATAAAQTAPQPISLDEAITLAQDSSPAMVQALGAQRTATASVRSAYAAFIPSLTLSTGSTRQVPAEGARTRIENGQVVILPSDPWSTNLGLGANLVLFAGGRRIFDLKQAHARVGAADMGMVEQTYAVRLDVQQQYFNALAAIESDSAARAQLGQAEQQFHASILKVRALTATRSDSLRAEIQVRNARLALLQAQTDLDVANAGLTRLVGTEYTVTASSSDSLDRPGLALDDAEIRRLAGEGPAVRQAESAVVSARAAHNSAWAAYLPTVNASYSRSGSGTSREYTAFGENLSYSGSIRFSVTLPVFDQLQREEQVTGAQVALATAEAQQRDARLAAQQSAVQELGAFHAAEERLTMQTLTVAASQEDLRVQQQRYSVGESTLLDVLASQAQLDQARRDLIRARYDLRVARAQLEALLGRAL